MSFELLTKCCKTGRRQADCSRVVGQQQQKSDRRQWRRDRRTSRRLEVDERSWPWRLVGRSATYCSRSKVQCCEELGGQWPLVWTRCARMGCSQPVKTGHTLGCSRVSLHVSWSAQQHSYHSCDIIQTYQVEEMMYLCLCRWCYAIKVTSRRKHKMNDSGAQLHVSSTNNYDLFSPNNINILVHLRDLRKTTR